MQNKPQETKIDLKTWKRKEHFDLFADYINPLFSASVQVKVTHQYQLQKKNGDLTAFIIYAIGKAVNEIPNFRLRIREQAGKREVVQLDFVHVSPIVLKEDETFNFCWVEFNYDFQEFKIGCRESFTAAKVRDGLFDPKGMTDDVVYLSYIPGLFFQSVAPSIHSIPISIPQIIWGDCQKQSNGEVLMPITVAAHHSLVDGLHMSRFFKALERIMNES